MDTRVACPTVFLSQGHLVAPRKSGVWFRNTLLAEVSSRCVPVPRLPGGSGPLNRGHPEAALSLSFGQTQGSQPHPRAGCLLVPSPFLGSSSPGLASCLLAALSCSSRLLSLTYSPGISLRPTEGGIFYTIAPGSPGRPVIRTV